MIDCPARTRLKKTFFSGSTQINMSKNRDVKGPKRGLLMPDDIFVNLSKTFTGSGRDTHPTFTQGEEFKLKTTLKTSSEDKTLKPNSPNHWSS